MKLKPETLGVLFCVASMLSFSMQDIVTKILLVDGLPLGQLLLVRYLAFTLFVLILIGSLTKLRQALRTQAPVAQIGRAGLSIGEIALINLSLAIMPVAKVHSIVALFPIIALVMAALLLRERVRGIDALAVLFGFAGALSLIAPAELRYESDLWMPFGGALMLAAFAIASKYVSDKDTLHTHLLYLGLICLILSLPFGVISWQEPSLEHWVLLLLLSVLNIASQFLFIKAMSFASATELQPFQYTLLLFATVFAALLLGEIPTVYTLIGGLLIVLGGLISMLSRRE